MDVKVEPQEDNKVKITVTVDAKDVDAKIKSTYKELARKYNFPGFRKGKAPRPVIDNALGRETVLAQVGEDLVNDAYPLAIDEQRLSPAGNPVFEDVDLPESGKPYTFECVVDIKPIVELDSYEPVEIELPYATATEAEINDQIESMREHYPTYDDANAQTKMKPENYADLAIKATDADGNNIETISTESRLYGPATGMLNDDFDVNIMGMKKGETRTFTLDVPADETSVLLGSQAGKPVTFEVTMNVVKKKGLPEVTDEWASETMGFATVEDLRQAIIESIEQQKGQLIPRMRENAVMNELLDRFDIEVPEPFVQDAESSLLQDFFTQLQREGLTFDTYLMQQNITSDQFKQDVKRQAADNVKEELALEAWARNHGIVVTEEEVAEEFVKAGVDDPAQLMDQWRAQGRLHLVRDGLLRAKALDDVLNTAVVTELDYAAMTEEELEADEVAAIVEDAVVEAIEDVEREGIEDVVDDAVAAKLDADAEAEAVEAQLEDEAQN